jgi:hypothetical protein
MILLLLAIPIVLPIGLAVCGIGKRSHYVGLSVGSFVLGLLLGLIGRTVKSEALFGIWILTVAATLGFLLASLVYRRRPSATG